MNAYARQPEDLDVKPALWQTGLHSQQPWDSKRVCDRLAAFAPLISEKACPHHSSPAFFTPHDKAPENHLDFPGLYHAQLTMRVG